MSTFDSPIPLSDIETVLAWVDSFKLSRPTKKINRDFSDAVLLAEILGVHYPKLVEMHNYPPRNSHSLKLNNWMTLNRKVLKKLKLNLCCDTMEQLANCAPGVIERVLVMVRDKIRRDEEVNKGKDSDQNMSSGGSYYEACGEDEHVLVVPVKVRVNGVLETVQQKVVNYEHFQTLKEELKDAKDSADVLKQKVEHLDSLLRLKEERIGELQKQLERKQVRRKEAESVINSLPVAFETVPSPAPITNDLYQNKTENTQQIPKYENFTSARHDNNEIVDPIVNTVSIKYMESVRATKVEESKIPVKLDSTIKTHSSKPSITAVKPSITAVVIELEDNLDRIKSDVFKEVEIVDDKTYAHNVEEFKDSEQDTVTIEETIQNEIKSITYPKEFAQGLNC